MEEKAPLRSKVTPVTVGRDTDQSFRVCKVNLATLKVAITYIKKLAHRTLEILECFNFDIFLRCEMDT